MNKKYLFTTITALILLAGIAVYFVFMQGNTNTTNLSNQNGIVVPSVSPDINGDIVSIIGNELTIKKYLVTTTLTADEKAAKQAERQNMTVEQRQALKAEENAATPSEIIKITIPVGSKIVKNSGEASMSGDNSNLILSNLDEAKPGFGIQIWKQNDEIILVKLKVI
jgi:hypothetical protein